MHVVPQVEKFNSDGSVDLINGSKIENIDVVVLCTGYRYEYPFLESWVGEIRGLSLSFPDCIFSPTSHHNYYPVPLTMVCVDHRCHVGGVACVKCCDDTMW